MYVCAKEENLSNLQYLETLRKDDKVLLKNDQSSCVKPENLLEKSYYAKIKEFLGEGSSCKNYEIKYKSPTKDIEEESILKELYPKQLCNSIDRVWCDKTESFLGIKGKNKQFTKLLLDEFERYKANYKQSLSLVNTSLKDNIVYIKDVFFDIVYKDGKKNIEHIDYIKAYLVTEKDNCESCINWIENQKSTLLERLKFFLVLINVVEEFYNEGYLISDLNLKNILYKYDGTRLKLKILDYDSIIKLSEINSQMFLPRTTPYYPKEYNNYNGIKKDNAVPIDFKSSIYSLGVIFLEILFSCKLNNDSLPDTENVHFLGFRNDSMRKDFSQFSNGFKNKVIQILRKSIRDNKKYRYDSFEEMREDVKILIEIYENKGVHPEVILNHAMEIAKTYKEKNDFDESLFTSVSEVIDN